MKSLIVGIIIIGVIAYIADRNVKIKVKDES